MQEKAFAIFRARKLMRGSRGKNSIGVCLKHLDNHLQSADISQLERIDENDTFQFVADEKKAIERAIEEHNQISKRAIRKDASVASEFIFTYSPEMEEMIDDNEFEDRIFAFIKSEFPYAKLLRMDYHTTESTPHWHILILNTTEHGTISSKAVLGGPKDFRIHQDHFAEYVADLGLQRGVPKEIRKQNNDKGAYNKPLWKYKSELIDNANKEISKLTTHIKALEQSISEKMNDLSKIADDVLSDTPNWENLLDER